jgi:hypothetical protein
MKDVLNIVIAHHTPLVVQRIVQYWSRFVPAESILLTYGGTTDHFVRIDHDPKIFIDDPHLRTRDHQRENQSYCTILQAVAEWLSNRPEFDWVQLSEFDHVPLTESFNENHRRFLESERADVVGYRLRQIDGTNSPHYLHASANDVLQPSIRELTVRRDVRTVLSMLGSSSFWTREAFTTVASTPHPRVYLELAMPTIAHHLGFRVLNAPVQQQPFVSPSGDRTFEIESAQAAGAWALHPVKQLFEPELSSC